MIGLMSALEAEAADLIAAMAAEGEVRTELRHGRPLRFGSLAGCPVVLGLSGVGKVAAAMTATVMVDLADTIIFVGTAGALAKAVQPGDLVVATALLQHDLDPRPLFPRWHQPELGLARFAPTPVVTQALLEAADQAVAVRPWPGAEMGLSQPRRHAGLIVSGDLFINSTELAWRLRNDLPDALAVEMEGAAVAQVCTAAGRPFGVVRIVSDRANGRASVDFSQFVSTVAARVDHDVVVGAVRRLTAV
ncbi:MAG: 5'-methylthioadenosine/adenosylhomocysteine nucleosidase [Propionibacteriaceae bacterium]|jgi:adenosylhomocysteine nucleosidase|nr:5'-methylthioadenosine/adenosylhomocysteine nucleosidase [Propionibacteriaceae bacterium]